VKNDLVSTLNKKSCPAPQGFQIKSSGILVISKCGQPYIAKLRHEITDSVDKFEKLVENLIALPKVNFEISAMFI
jgi:hypothetical protein